MIAWIRWLFTAEVPEIGERYRPLATAFVWLFAVAFSVGFLQLLHVFVYLGPGLGDPVSFEPLRELLQRLYQSARSSDDYALLLAMLALMLFNLGFRFAVIVAGYSRYRGARGEKFPMRLIALFTLTNTVSALSIPLLLVLVAGALYLAGLDLHWGLDYIERTAALANGWVNTHVPTLIELPAFAAVLVVFMLGGFVHYWLHRLGHTRRALWLLFHRHHHMSPALMQSTTLAVFTAVPLFLLFVLPYNLLFGAITKLFAAQPLYAEVIVFNLVLLIPEIFGHQTALYERAIRFRWLRWGGYLFGNGVYHYLHHSAEPADAGREGAVNMVNMGGGFCFVWDQLFGTYRPLSERAPKVGLTGSPELHMNPLRLAYSGMLQIAYELWHNRDWKTRLCILFGSSGYTPPVSRDFAVKNAVGSLKSEV